MYSVASGKESNSQKAHLNTSIINADGDGDEMHKVGGGRHFGALLQKASENTAI